MTEDQWQSLERYVRQVADGLRLRDWTVNVERDAPENPDAGGSVRIIYGRKLAYIRVCSDFASYTPQEQRHTVIHELIHIHLEPACNIVLNDVREYLGRAADDLLWSGFKRSMEYGVDGLADAVAPLLPLWEKPPSDG